ncbi:MAG: beta-ketoacyl-ACP synthase II [bacterium]
MKRVVITGMDVITSLGVGKEQLWDKAKKGESGIDRIQSFDPSPFSTQIAGEVLEFEPSHYLENKEAKRMDRFSQFAVVTTEMAIKDADLRIEKKNQERIGVIIGSGVGGMITAIRGHEGFLEKGPRKVGPFFISSHMMNSAASYISIKTGVKGPNITISTACSSGTQAIGVAFNMIRQGHCQVVISGGVDTPVTPFILAGFCATRALSKNNNDPVMASRPFDKDRDGFVLSEGCGILILEELKHALKREAGIKAELIGYGASSDASHIVVPDADGAILSFQRALKDAGIFPDEIDYINAHGTSTSLNDRIETEAIKRVFGDYAYKIPITSIKSSIGHTIGASGAIGLVATILSMNYNLLLPTINYMTPDPACDLDYVPNRSRKKEINTALLNSLSFGGNNAALIVKKFRP